MPAVTPERFDGASGTGFCEQQLNVPVVSSHAPGQRSPGFTMKPPVSAQVPTRYRLPGEVVTGAGGDTEGGVVTVARVWMVLTGESIVTGVVTLDGGEVFAGAGTRGLPGAWTVAQPATTSMAKTRIAKAIQPLGTVMAVQLPPV